MNYPLKKNLRTANIEFDIDFPGASSLVKSELEYPRLQDPTVSDNNAFSLLAQGTF